LIARFPFLVLSDYTTSILFGFLYLLILEETSKNPIHASDSLGHSGSPSRILSDTYSSPMRVIALRVFHSDKMGVTPHRFNKADTSLSGSPVTTTEVNFLRGVNTHPRTLTNICFLWQPHYLLRTDIPTTLYSIIILV